MLERRPQVHPGAFKTMVNRGDRAFLTPETAEERGVRLELPGSANAGGRHRGQMNGTGAQV